ncbi:MAG: ATP-binding protein [Chloroflexota bacterium]|nr:MAG: ATP-binding protein [Chloroflexota bacterium]
MNPLKNPFSPGAGSPPPELAGRQPLLERAKIALVRLKNGKSEKSLLLVGLRGVGKTVLLNKIHELAESEGFYSVQIEAHENKSLAALLLPSLRQVLFRLDRMEKVSEKVKLSFRVLKSFFNGIKMKVHDIEFSLDVDPETGIADSGDIESDLPALLLTVAEAASDRGAAIVIIIDELQYLTEKEFSALIMSIHKITQKQFPLVLVGAGLPQLVGLAGRSKSYAERLFDFTVVGPLNDEDATKALQEPVKAQKVLFSSEAVDEILSKTKGYPYFIQEWGYHTWNLANESPINLDSAKSATQESIRRLDESFFRVRFDRLTPKEKKYIRALAELGPGAHRSGEVAKIFGDKMQSLSPIRSNLIKKGMIYSPTYGDTEFTVPLFDEFIIRVMPDLDKNP